jgi:NhaP-type Na+/H+ or K+/H+ antiporter
MEHSTLIVFAVIGLIAFACQWVSWWLKIPAILFLLVCGIILGPELHWLQPDSLFGPVLVPMIQLSVAIILFEGSLSLKFDEWGEVASVVRNLVTVGVIVTAILSACFAYWIFGFSWKICTLFGAIISVTGPTVIVPILRTLRPKQRIANILRWEGILIDPIGAILAVLTFGFISALNEGHTYIHVIYHFIELIVVATTIGIVVGYWLGVSLRRHWFPEYLQNIATLTVVIAAYTASNLVDEGSGLLTVTIMGIFIANMRAVHIEDILDFKENLSILLISGIFIILAARVHFYSLHSFILPAVALFVTLQFIVRPFSVFLCTLKSDLAIKEKIILSWICPRGIVAAAVAALFSIRLDQIGIAGGQQLVLITFLMIIGTVIFQSLTASTLAKLLKVSEPEPKGFLIIGANPVARILATALMNNGFRALVVGMSWTNVKESRMAGINAYYGNAISEHADRHLDLVGIGNMLAVTPQEDLNTLAAMRYRGEFGRNHTFAIQCKTASDKDTKHKVASRHQGQPLFGNGVTFSKLASLISQDATIKSTQLTKSFDFKSYCVKNQNNVIPLFAIDPKGNIHFFSHDESIEPKVDWTIVSLNIAA